MALLRIVTYPAPVLLKPAKPIERFDEKLAKLAEDMIETMLKAPGAGLAAPQVGVSQRVFVVNAEYLGPDAVSLAVVNPTIVKSEGSSIAEEGCLSLPDLRGDVKRATRVLVRAQTITGETVEYDWSDWLARIAQHEIDHLDGVLFPDRMYGLKKATALRGLKRLARGPAPVRTGASEGRD